MAEPQPRSRLIDQLLYLQECPLLIIQSKF